MACGFAGNPDVYGIGIRIGYYTQAIAVWFANYFHFREAKVLRSVNNLFLIALTIVGLVYIYDARKIYAVEAFLLLYIGTTMAILSMLDGTRFTSRFINASNERLIAKILISIMGQAFLVYFWWTGLNIMRPTPCTDVGEQPSNTLTTTNGTNKGTYGFYIVPTNMYGWLRTLMRILSLTGLARSTLILTTSAPAKVLHSMMTKKTKAAFVEAGIAQIRSSPMLRATLAEKVQATLLGSRVQAPRPSTIFSYRILSNGLPRASALIEQRRNIETDDNKIVAFPTVFEAERYLDSIFSILGTAEAARHKCTFTICNGYLRFYNPFLRLQKNPELVPVSKCFHALFIWYGLSRLPMNLKWRFHIHLAGLNGGPRFIWPRLLYRAFQLSKDSEPPHWKTVAIASDAQLSQIPLKKSSNLWAFYAVKNLFLIILFIVQIELTIVWNHINDLDGFTSLGQLIPFILGVGGLVKVLWSKWRLIHDGVREDTDYNSPPLTKYEAALKTYLEWKKLYRTPLTSVPTDQLQQQGCTNAAQIFHKSALLTAHTPPNNSSKVYALRRSLSH